MAHSIYEDLTRQIIEALKKGRLPWIRPWNTFIIVSMGGVIPSLSRAIASPPAVNSARTQRRNRLR